MTTVTDPERAQRAAKRIRDGRNTERGRTVLTERVKCSFAPGGTHELCFVLNVEGRIVHMSSTCERMHPGSSRALHRLDAVGTCGHLLRETAQQVFAGHWTGGLAAFSPVFHAALGAVSDATRRHLTAKAMFKPEPAHPHAQRVKLLSDTLTRELGLDGSVVDKPVGSESAAARRARRRRGDSQVITKRPTASVTCDRKGRPQTALIGSLVVARRVTVGWMLDPATVSATASTRIVGKDGCPVCARGLQGAAKPAIHYGFSNDAQLNAHARSAKHLRVFENTLLEALHALPGTGSKDE